MPDYFDETAVFLNALFANKKLIKAHIGDKQVQNTGDVLEVAQSLEPDEVLTVNIEVTEAEALHKTGFCIANGEVGYKNPCQFFDEIEEVVIDAQDEFYKYEPKYDSETEI